MCCNKEQGNCGCISDILSKILCLQKQDFDNENYSGCDKPYLGPICNTICYNTRPIMLYNGTRQTNQTNIFRVEALDECCCTVRLLNQNEETNTLTGTNEFATINLNCCGACKCLTDTYIDLCN